MVVLRENSSCFRENPRSKTSWDHPLAAGDESVTSSKWSRSSLRPTSVTLRTNLTCPDYRGTAPSGSSCHCSIRHRPSFMNRAFVLALLFAVELALLFAVELPAQQAPPPSASPTIPARWDVSARRATAKDLSFETSTGTFMSLDVSPDGRTIVFDLLGDIYTMPSLADRPRWYSAVQP